MSSTTEGVSEHITQANFYLKLMLQYAGGMGRGDKLYALSVAAAVQAVLWVGHAVLISALSVVSLIQEKPNHATPDPEVVKAIYWSGWQDGRSIKPPADPGSSNAS